jgi:peptidyl-prolyl cis-trans isomerase B (cyclophilin B)
MKTNFLCTLLGLVLLTACNRTQPTTSTESSGKTDSAPAAAEEKKTSSSDAEVAVITTTEGEMVVEFWPDVAPKTVENFKKLAKEKFYDGTAFHRVIKGFMIQGGDPLTKDPSQKQNYGGGGPGYQIKGEVNNQPNRGHQRGVLSMANSGHPDTAGSQFFICLAPQPRLDGGYTTFGKVIKGDDVLEKIGNTPCTGPNSMGEMSIPEKRAGVESIKIVPADSVK